MFLKPVAAVAVVATAVTIAISAIVIAATAMAYIHYYLIPISIVISHNK